MVDALLENPDLTALEIGKIIRTDLEARVKALRNISYEWEFFAFLLDVVISNIDYTTLCQEFLADKGKFLKDEEAY